MCSAMHLAHKSEACCKGDGDSEGRDIKVQGHGLEAVGTPTYPCLRNGSTSGLSATVMCSWKASPNGQAIHESRPWDNRFGRAQ